MESKLHEKEIQSLIASWKNSPELYFEQALGIDNLWDGERAMLRAVPVAIKEKKNIIVPSGHSLGKDFICGGLVPYFLQVYGPCIVITTAPTGRQVDSVMWGEIEARYNSAKIKLPGRLLTSKIEIDSKWYALGFTTKETGQMVGKFQGFHCLSEDTEILTNRGWKTYDAISIVDKILTVPVGQNKAHWEGIEDIYVYPYDGELNVYDSRCASFAVTEEHRFPTKYDHRSLNWSLKSFSETKKKFILQRKLSWAGKEFQVPSAFKGFSPSKFAEFVGFWTGDGGTRKHSKGDFYEVLFYQKKKSGCDYIEYLLSGLSFSKKQDYYSLSNKNICKWLIEKVGRYGKDRIVPEILRNAKPEILNAYIRGIWMAEGSCYKNGKYAQLYNTSKVLMDNVQEMLLKLGRPTTLGINTKKGHRLCRNTCYVLSFTETSSDHRVDKKDVKKEKYKGTVWCISTKHQTFVARRNGKIFVSGNSPRVFVIASEAQAISDVVYEQIDAILTGEIGLLIQIGNPLRATGQFARDIKNTKDNLVIHLSCLDSPNYIQRKTVVPGVCSYEWVEKKRKQWGEDDPRWVARVLGQVPKTSIDTVFSQELVEKRIGAETFSSKVKRGVGIDVARFGDDETVIYGGTNGKVEAQDIYTGQSTTTTAARGVIIHNRIKKGNFFVVDGDGVGGGTIDTLTDMQLPHVDIIEIHGAGKTINEDYQNKRAEMAFIAQKRLEEGEASIPDDQLLIEELLEIKYFINKRGKIQIEEKDDIKERLGRSPNRADAWIMLQYGFSQASYIKHKEGWGSLNEENSAVFVAGAGSGAMVG